MRWRTGRSVWIGVIVCVVINLLLVLTFTVPNDVIYPLTKQSTSTPVPLSPSSPLYYSYLNFKDHANMNPLNKITNYKTMHTTGHTVNMTKYMTCCYPLSHLNYFQISDTDHFPLNSIVYHPEHLRNHNKYPLVLILQDNVLFYKQRNVHEGYSYIAKTLSQRGYIVALIDQNYLNGYSKDDDDIFIRGYLALKHLQLFEQLNSDPTHVLYEKIDWDNIALIGHGRGGGAIHMAHALSHNQCVPSLSVLHHCVEEQFTFTIRSLVYMAPDFGLYGEAISQLNPLTHSVNTLLLHGLYDAKVLTAYGVAALNRVVFDHQRSTDDFISVQKFLYQANHNQFNSIFPDCDAPTPSKWLLHKSPVMSASDQRTLTSLYISAFFDTMLKQEFLFRAFLRDERTGYNWLPHRGLTVTRFRSNSNFVMVNDFEDYNQTTNVANSTWVSSSSSTTTHVSEMVLRSKSRTPQLNKGLFITFDQSDHSQVHLHWNKSISIDESDVVLFDIAIAKGGLSQVKIQVNGEGGKSLNVGEYYSIPRQLEVRLYKIPLSASERYLVNDYSETLLQSIEIPIKDFKLVVDKIQSIHLQISASRGSQIVIDNVGILRFIL